MDDTQQANKGVVSTLILFDVILSLIRLNAGCFVFQVLRYSVIGSSKLMTLKHKKEYYEILQK